MRHQEPSCRPVSSSEPAPTVVATSPNSSTMGPYDPSWLPEARFRPRGRWMPCFSGLAFSCARHAGAHRWLGCLCQSLPAGSGRIRTESPAVDRRSCGQKPPVLLCVVISQAVDTPTRPTVAHRGIDSGSFMRTDDLAMSSPQTKASMKRNPTDLASLL